MRSTQDARYDTIVMDACRFVAADPAEEVPVEAAAAGELLPDAGDGVHPGRADALLRADGAAARRRRLEARCRNTAREENKPKDLDQSCVLEQSIAGHSLRRRESALGTD